MYLFQGPQYMFQGPQYMFLTLSRVHRYHIYVLTLSRAHRYHILCLKQSGSEHIVRGTPDETLHEGGRHGPPGTL